MATGRRAQTRRCSRRPTDRTVRPRRARRADRLRHGRASRPEDHEGWVGAATWESLYDDLRALPVDERCASSGSTCSRSCTSTATSIGRRPRACQRSRHHGGEAAAAVLRLRTRKLYGKSRPWAGFGLRTRGEGTWGSSSCATSGARRLDFASGIGIGPIGARQKQPGPRTAHSPTNADSANCPTVRSSKCRYRRSPERTPQRSPGRLAALVHSDAFAADIRSQTRRYS